MYLRIMSPRGFSEIEHNFDIEERKIENCSRGIGSLAYNTVGTRKPTINANHMEVSINT